MTNVAVVEGDLQFRRMKRRTRWLTAFLEGAAAAIFIGIVNGPTGLLRPPALTAIATAFVTTTFVAFALWPMTIKEREFSLIRLTTFGVMVVFVGGYLWLLILQLSLPSHLPDVSHLQHLWNRYSEPGQLLRLLMDTLAGALVGTFTVGIFGIGIAWLVAFFGYKLL